MRRMLASLLLLTGSWVSYVETLRGQELPDKVTEMLIRSVEESGVVPDESGIEEILDYYRELLLFPLNINNAGREELERLIILTDWQVEAILSYKEEFGNLLSLNELYNIPGLPSQSVSILIQFLTTETDNRKNKYSVKDLCNNVGFEMISRVKYLIEKEKGFKSISKSEFDKHPDSRYLGPRGQFYSQFKLESMNHLNCAVTLERDAGEKGVDYKSINFSLMNTGCIDKVILGDFSARFGQGLVLWNTFAMNSYSDSKGLLKYPAGISPYNSTDENRSLRGAAVTFRAERWKFSLLVSQRKYDARVVGGTYTSLLKTGLHNTKTTLERKGALGGSLIGSNLTWSGNNIRISQTSAIYRYSMPYGGRDSVLRKRDLSMDGFQANFSLDGYLTMKKVRFFGEVAADHIGSFAAIAGALYSPSNRLETALVLRNYSEEYRAPFASPIARNLSIGGERGGRVCATLSTGKYWKTSVTFELLKNYYNLTLYATKSIEERGISTSIKYNWSDQRHCLRYNHSFRISPKFTACCRFDFNVFTGKETDIGYHLFGETVFRAFSGKFDASLRAAYFNVPVWETRVYVHERDALHNFSIPFYYGEGIRCYLNVHIASLKKVDLWIRISSTRYLDRNESGEGTTLISCPSKSEAKLQLKLSL